MFFVCVGIPEGEHARLSKEVLGYGGGMVRLCKEVMALVAWGGGSPDCSR